MSTTYGRTEIVLLDGTRDLTRDLVGGKAYGVNYMRKLGMPVPPAFTLPTAICRQFRALNDNLPDDIDEVLAEGIAWLERETGRTFGGDEHPLLVSVRSGAAQSMPGMMDTVLNLGTSPPVRGGPCGGERRSRLRQRHHPSIPRAVRAGGRFPAGRRPLGSAAGRGARRVPVVVLTAGAGLPPSP